MLKIDNLSNDIDTTAVLGGQSNNMTIVQGGAAVEQWGGFVNAVDLVNAPKAIGYQNNSDYTSIYTQQTSNATSLFGSLASAVA